MPPRITVPNENGTIPPDLIPDPDLNDTNSDDTFAGVPIISARAQTQDAFNALIYAYPGVGKTSLAGMFAAYPPACDVLVVDAEGGASVLSHLDNVFIAQVKSWRETDRIMTTLERTPKAKQRFHTVIFDNLTEYHAMLLQSIAGTGAVEIQHHGRATSEIMRFSRRARDLSRFLGINTILIAWQDNKEDKTRGIIRQTVALTDKLSARAPGIPNNVGYLTILNNPPLYTRKLSFAASPLNDAKFRRAPGDESPSIPLEIFYGIDQNPVVDMLKTLYEGVPFPEARYQRPKGRGKTKVVDPDDNTADSDAPEPVSATE